MKTKHLGQLVVLTFYFLSVARVAVFAATPNDTIGLGDPSYRRIVDASAQQDLACLKKLNGLQVSVIMNTNAEAIGIRDLQDKAEVVLRRNGIKTYGTPTKEYHPQTGFVSVIVNVYPTVNGQAPYEINISVSPNVQIPETGYSLNADVVGHNDSGFISSTQSAAQVIGASLEAQLDWLSNVFLKANEAVIGSK